MLPRPQGATTESHPAFPPPQAQAAANRPNAARPERPILLSDDRQLTPHQENHGGTQFVNYRAEDRPQNRPANVPPNAPANRPANLPPLVIPANANAVPGPAAPAHPDPRHQTGPVGVGGFTNPRLSTDPNHPGMAAMLQRQELEHTPGGGSQSQWNGYKPISANMRASMGEFNHTTGPNPGSIVDRNRTEVAQTMMHQGVGQPLRPGQVVQGTTHHVDQTPEMQNGDPHAVVDNHLHPNRGRRTNGAPSMNDQMMFRDNPHVEHAVQVPGRPGSTAPQYVTANGAFPPRHYTLVNWPANQPLPPPNSPDFNRMPPFRDPPAGYNGHIGSPLAPSSPSSSGSSSE